MDTFFSKKILLLGFFISFISISPESSGVWKIDLENSSIGFHVKAKIENVRGNFESFELKEFKGKENIESLHGKIIVHLDSINTKSKKRDNHLRSKDFFEIERFPNGVVIVKKILKNESGFIASISIELKNKKKDYLVPVEIKKEKSSVNATGTFQINRSDFDINGNTITNIIMDDNVELYFSILLKKSY
jgi:polyisoprenoid-binding protein YceI